MATSPIVRVTKAHPALVPEHTTRAFGPGQVCLDAEVGDVVLIRHGSFVAKGIRAFERLRVPKPFCWTNHAAVVLTSGPSAQIIQEGGNGSALAPLATMVSEGYTVTRFAASEDQEVAGARFLTSTLGTGYGYLSIFADAFNALTGLELGLGWGNRMVCSTQTARYMERVGYVPDRSPYAITPAHLAWHLNITEPKG